LSTKKKGLIIKKVSGQFLLKPTCWIARESAAGRRQVGRKWVIG